MRTVIIIVGGLVLLGLAVLVGRWLGGAEARSMATAAQLFVPVWVVIALVNLWMGTRAGYSVTEELPIFLLIFVIPAGAAAFIWWKLS